MKKILALALLSLLLIGCTKEKFYFDDLYYKEYKIEEVDSNTFNELVKDKSSFAVFVYLSGCTSCSKFSTVLDSVLKEKNVTVLKLSYKDLKGTILEDKVKYSPSLVLINKGTIESYLRSDKDSDLIYFEDSEKLEEWINNYAYLSKE